MNEPNGINIAEELNITRGGISKIATRLIEKNLITTYKGEKNQKKIRWGIRCVILIPLVFLMLTFSMDSSKVVFLVLWIVSLFTISAYLIYVEYMDYTLQMHLAELGIKEDATIDDLLPDKSLIAQYLTEEDKA